MNCANHPETPATAYCQFCGKPLCDSCIHKVNNIISCEPCLAARVHAATADTYDSKVNYGQGAQNTGAGNGRPGGLQPQPVGPGTWILLGLISWIPGVGAVYNGQLAKALAHVIIFAMLVDLTHYNGVLGLLVAAWIFYQVFDAYQTAIARRDGLPLPNPLGLNNIGQWFGARNPGPYPGAKPVAPNPPVPPAPGVAEPEPASGFASSYVPPPASSYVPPASGYAPPYTYNAPPMPPVPPNQYDTPGFWHRQYGGGVPTGAVILIVLGVLFLLGNFGILRENWLDHGWPILLIALGVWIVIRHSQSPPAGGVR